MHASVTVTPAQLPELHLPEELTDGRTFGADFPKDGPVLVITDAMIDRVRVRREHAFLIPAGATLPFTPRGPVFRFS